MMAALFLVFALAIAAILWQQRILAMALIVAGIILCLLMFCHHATDILKINL